MNENDTENAGPGLSPDRICSRCGLAIGQRGSFTYWIFRDHRCQCDAGVSSELNKSQASSREAPGKQILNERYELIECVGKGGVGFVYRGQDLTTGQHVALKIMRPELAQNDQAVRRVIREVEVVSRLSHSNLGQVYGYGQEKGGAPYLVMEFAEGQNLEELLKVTGELKLARAINIFMQLCSGLACAHMNGIIHRDLKPSNVIVQQEPNGQDHATIVDFGFARLLRESSDSLRLTQEGEVFGSPAYMSPEQCLGEELDHRSDIYALGCLMYEVLAGTPPLVGENVLATVAKQIKATPASMRLHDPTIPESIDAVVLKCLNKEPLMRYQSVSDLRLDLDKVKKGEYVNAPSKRVHNRAKTDKDFGDRRSLRSAEDDHRKITSLVGVILLAAVLIGGGAGVSAWILMQSQRSAGQSAPPAVPPKSSAVDQEPGKDEKYATQKQPSATAKLANSNSIQTKNLMHRQNPITHTPPQVHPSVQPVSGARHGAAIAHSQKPSAAKHSTSWDQLKGLRVYK